jgi:hypothetical protein
METWRPAPLPPRKCAVPLPRFAGQDDYWAGSARNFAMLAAEAAAPHFTD